MQERVKRLEDQVAVLVTDVAAIKSNYATKEDVASIRADVAVIKSNYATKADVEALKVDFYKALMKQTTWLAASQFVTLGAGLTLAKMLF